MVWKISTHIHSSIREACDVLCTSIKWTPELEDVRYRLAEQRNVEVHRIWTGDDFQMLKNHLKNEYLKTHLSTLKIDHSLCVDIVAKLEDLYKEARIVKDTNKTLIERQRDAKYSGEITSNLKECQQERRRKKKPIERIKKNCVSQWFYIRKIRIAEFT